MNVNGNGMMQQTQMQTQMHKMDGTGGGQGKGGANGMKDIMQGLKPTDRVALQEQLSAMSEDQRVAVKEELKAIDGTNLSSDEYLQSLLSAINSNEDTTATEEFTPIYA
ncbi:MAG: hypothetical protein PHV52_08565 [Aliarcobacter sp.]|jgi:hypothetical protein|nr:hypothetical protein [Aliarcobacter sp.]